MIYKLITIVMICLMSVNAKAYERCFSEEATRKIAEIIIEKEFQDEEIKILEETNQLLLVTVEEQDKVINVLTTQMTHMRDYVEIQANTIERVSTASKKGCKTACQTSLVIVGVIVGGLTVYIVRR